jgi:hypothetical protein
MHFGKGGSWRLRLDQASTWGWALPLRRRTFGLALLLLFRLFVGRDLEVGRRKAQHDPVRLRLELAEQPVAWMRPRPDDRLDKDGRRYLDQAAT